MHLVGTFGPTLPACQIYQWGNRAYRHGGREYRTIGAVDESEERRIFPLVLALILIALGLVLVIGVKYKYTLVIGRLTHTQQIVKCGFPFMNFAKFFFA